MRLTKIQEIRNGLARGIRLIRYLNKGGVQKTKVKGKHTSTDCSLLTHRGKR